MGYRSEVAYELRGNKETLLAGLCTLRLDGDAIMKAALDELRYKDVSDKELIVRYHQENIKWYQEYTDVAAHCEIFSHFEDIYHDKEPSAKECIHGSFIRIGEDTNDVEENYFGDEISMYVPSPKIMFDNNFDDDTP